MERCICNGNIIRISDCNWMDDSITIKNGNVLHIEGETPCGYENTNYEIDVKIKFCPLCGKELADGN